jgi:hypothetical protein
VINPSFVVLGRFDEASCRHANSGPAHESVLMLELPLDSIVVVAVPDT